MDMFKWVGIILVSIVMGMVCGGFALLAEPSVSMAIRVALEIIGTAVVLHQMAGLKRIGETIETDHGKQFD
jgi:spore maturation protein SpmA